MERNIYELMASVQSKHWWFLGRKKAFRSLVCKLNLPKTARILEIGAGTGANLKMLAKFGDVYACESDEESCKYLEEDGWRVMRGDLPHGLPLYDFKFDLICLFDVLEHVDNDSLSIAKIKELLAPSGMLIIACPAYQWLYGAYDEALGHFRRYTRKSLDSLLVENKLEVVSSGYLNVFLFPLIAGGRILEYLGVSIRNNALKIPPREINKLLLFIFSIESSFIRWSLFPFGVTVISISRPMEYKK